MSAADIEFAEIMAKRLGFTQTAYTSTSLPGLYYLPDNDKQKHGVIIKSREYGFLMLADCEDLGFHDLQEKQLTKQNQWSQVS